MATRVDGAPTKIVLIHGIGANRCVWTPVERQLGDGFRCVAIDLPGHGATGGQFNLARALEDVGAACSSGQPPRLLVGWSLGGLLALIHVAAHPEGIAGVVLVSASIQPRLVLGWLFRHAHWLAPVLDSGLVKGLIGRIVVARCAPGAAADVLACGLAPGEGVRSLRDVAPIDFLGLAREIRVPILIVNGWRDIIARPRERAFLAAAPDATIEIVARAGHLLPAERPNELAALIGAFAERTRRLLPEQRPED